MPEKVAVYLGSSPGNSPKFRENAYGLGAKLAEKKIEVIYGGASVGTMKSLAEGVLSRGGRLTGVFPDGFRGKKEYADKGLDERFHQVSEMVVTEGLSDRIATMEKMSDACIVLPGSYGTLNELFSYLLNRQLGFHSKPIYVLNTDGYYRPLKDLIDNMVKNGFISPADGRLLTFCDEVDELLEKLD